MSSPGPTGAVSAPATPATWVTPFSPPSLAGMESLEDMLVRRLGGWFLDEGLVNLPREKGMVEEVNLEERGKGEGKGGQELSLL